MSSHEFNEMLVSNADHLKPYAFTLTRDSEAARDLLQETLCRALINKDKYHVGTNIKAWIYTIMRNIFINDYRRRHKYATVSVTVGKEFLLDQHSDNTSNDAIGKLQWKEIQRAIYSLPDIFRHPFQLYYEGYKYNEIADVLTVPLGTIKSRIHFSRKLLQEELRMTNYE